MASSAYACSCDPVSTQRLISSSEAVFSGEVVDLERNQKDPASHDGAIPSPFYRFDRVSFRVSEVWKGPRRETLEVITPRHEAACGYPFKEGQEYLVFAYDKQDLKVDACSGTQLLSEAHEDLALLGHGEKLKVGGAMVGIAGLAMAASFVVVRLVRAG